MNLSGGVPVCLYLLCYPVRNTPGTHRKDAYLDQNISLLKQAQALHESVYQEAQEGVSVPERLEDDLMETLKLVPEPLRTRLIRALKRSQPYVKMKNYWPKWVSVKIPEHVICM